MGLIFSVSCECVFFALITVFLDCLNVSALCRKELLSNVFVFDTFSGFALV